VESAGCIRVKFNFSLLCHLRYQTQPRIQAKTKNEYAVSIIAVYRIGKYFNNRTGIGADALVRQWNIAIEISI
jgi:hypothetical protein